MKKLIIFICNGNIHRSVIAAASLKKIFKERKISSKFSVDSYGLQGTEGTDLPKHKRLSEYPDEWNAAKSTLKKFNINISKHGFQKISVGVMKKANVIIAMDDKTYSGLTQFPNQSQKVHRFSELTLSRKTINDPAGSSNRKLHQKIIRDIHISLGKKYKDILAWL